MLTGKIKAFLELEFKQVLQNLHLKNKETAVFHAELNLDVQGVWFKDGRQVMENERTKVYS